MIHDGFFGVEAIRTAVHDVGATLPGMVFAWSEGMGERYQQENGYDLIPRLGALLYNMADGSRATKQQYYDTITRWYVEAIIKRSLHGAKDTDCCTSVIRWRSRSGGKPGRKAIRRASCSSSIMQAWII